MRIHIRRAGIEDVDTIAPLFDAYRIFYRQPPDPELARCFIRERLEQNQSIIFLALDENDLALGFTQLYPSFSSASAKKIFILNDLFVVPAARRQNAARSLLEAATDFARGEGAARLTLSTAMDNSAAQALYEAAGWLRDNVFLTYTFAL